MSHKIRVILRISVVKDIQCMKPLFVKEVMLMFTRMNYNNSSNLKSFRESWNRLVKADIGSWKSKLIRESWNQFVKVETGSWKLRLVRERWDWFVKLETDSWNLRQVREIWDRFAKLETGSWNLRPIRESWNRFVKFETGSWNLRPIPESLDRFLKFETDSWKLRLVWKIRILMSLDLNKRSKKNIIYTNASFEKWEREKGRNCHRRR